MILAELPSPEEFYKSYWGKKSFVVRSAIAQDVFDDLIDADSLAGLSLEEDIKSRIVKTLPQEQKWACEHGPFAEDYYSTLGEENWSLLVQNVEQYHVETAALLKSFNFAPRWLMDDIMVSYSTKGGSVGPHTDSYHVFLVQGMGRREWKIGRAPLQSEECIEGLYLKVLKEGVDGEAVEVSKGDVIYIPPNFPHEGVTLEEALTFSVGFLGPKMSELLMAYGQYVEQQEVHDTLYSGQSLDTKSSGFSISSDAQKNIQNDLVSTIQSGDFSSWLVEYFSMPSHDDIENMEGRDSPLLATALLERLQSGESLYRPEHVKLSITQTSDGNLNLAVYGKVVPMSIVQNEFMGYLNQHNLVSLLDIEKLGGWDNLMDIVMTLYNQNVLFFEKDDII